MGNESSSPWNGDYGEESDHLAKTESSPADKFEPPRQTWRLFKDQTPHLTITFVLVALFITTLVLFEKAGNVSHKSKLWFNTITTILNLALALNFSEAFKDMAKVLRWRVLANRSFTIREADLILGGESLMKLGKLIWESPKKPVTVLVCASWITLNFLAQASIAMLSLNYSMDSGTNSTGIYTGDGIVNASKLDCYNEHGGCPVVPSAQMTTAHTYGELIRGQQCCRYHDVSDIQHADQACPYFCHDNGQEFAYRYAEYNPLDTTQAYPYFTNRTVTASASQCYKYDIDWANSPLTSGTDGINDVQVFAFTNRTFTGHLPIPRSVGGFNSTTYVYNGSAVPQDETETACGPRCLRIYALRLGSPPQNNESANIFSCQITVSEVYNATRDWQFLPNTTARLAATSIALTGRYTSPPGRGNVWQQYQLYSWGSQWETYHLNAQQIGAGIAEFTVGSLAAMANLNPKQQVPGTLPMLGYHLDAQWRFFIALAACIGVVHCLLVAAMLWIARPVIVIDDSTLCTARLLQGLVGRLEGRGSLFSGKRLAEEIQKAGSKDGKVVYGISHGHDLGGQRVLEIGEDVPVRKALNGGRFPKGSYA